VPIGGWSRRRPRKVSRGVEADILPTCRELGVGITAYGVLSRGLLSGHWAQDQPLAPGDFRGASPRFRDGNVEHNLGLVEALRAVTDARGTTVAQLAIGWVLSRGEDIVPLVGARRRDRLAEAIPAVDLDLTADDVAAIEQAVPSGSAAGERYDERQMAILDSERASPPGASGAP
jgi:aryl-alcohol dehydrogenase-like predicted oxidoreductase